MYFTKRDSSPRDLHTMTLSPMVHCTVGVLNKNESHNSWLIVVNSFNRKSVTPIQVSAFFPTFSYEYSYGIAPSRGRFILNIMTTNFQTLKNLKLQFYQYTTTSWSSEYVHNCFPHFLLSKFLQVNTQKRPESILSNISSIAQMFKIRPLKWLLGKV